MSTDSIPQKQCPHCKAVYPATLEYFHKHTRNSKPGLSSWCKVCQNELRAKNAKEHPEVRRAHAARNREHIRQRDKDWYAKNPKQQEKKRKQAKEWRDENLDYARQKSRDYGRAHIKEIVERNKEWAKNNPERYKAIMANRYARDKNAEGFYTQEDINNIYEELGGRCEYCGISIFFEIPRDVHIDHIIPLSRGGTNWPDNLTLACRECNCSKSDKTPEEWALVRGW